MRTVSMVVFAGVWACGGPAGTGCGDGGRSPSELPESGGDESPRDVAQVPEWVIQARVAGVDVYPEMSDDELASVLQERAAENVSVVELDSRMSAYLSEVEFARDAAFLDRAAQMAHALGMKALIYYPALEIVTLNGANIEHTMFKDHPDWVQRGLDGRPNVYYGEPEGWIEQDAESAWLSPNGPYRDQVIARVRALAATAADGIWLDVALYSDIATDWAGAEDPGAQAFREWSAARGDPGGGHAVPAGANFAEPAFRAWVRWRHENLASYIDSIRRAAHEVDPDFIVAVEVSPVDHLDATLVGLDGNFRVSGENLVQVWEITSVSASQAMAWASYEDFNGLIAMSKYGKAAGRMNPAWMFSYGYRPDDAALTIGAAFATGVAPFECRTPQMTSSVDSAFRARWYGFLADHSAALLATPRVSSVGVWYSTATRDYVDGPIGGSSGMYITEQAPPGAVDWWNDAAPGPYKPHLAEWRGAAHVLIQLGMPFRVITEPGSPAEYLEDVELLWLPSVSAMSDESAQAIEAFVAGGGTLLATGESPGTMDELGGPREDSALAGVFGFAGAAPFPARARRHGAGFAIYRPDLRSAEAYALAGDEEIARRTLSALEQILRLHTPDLVRFDGGPGVHVEVARESRARHYLYALNYTGLQVPIVPHAIDLTIGYRPGRGYRVSRAEVFTPESTGQPGVARVAVVGDGLYEIDVHLDTFALVALDIELDVPADPADPVDGEPALVVRAGTEPARPWREAIDRGLAFIRDRMRDPRRPGPHAFGVFTSYLDDPDNADASAHGHHVTSENMGLLLRVAACVGDDVLYQQTYRYVRDVMTSPLYRVANRIIDRRRLAPLVELSTAWGDGTPRWLHASAPADDLRLARGLLAGPRREPLPGPTALADAVLGGLYWTSVTHRRRGGRLEFPRYPDGVVGAAWRWEETDDPSLTPAAAATGHGRLTVDPIPVAHQDLRAISLAAARDSRWRGVLAAATDLLLASEIAGSGLFYNGLRPGGQWTGDFEHQGAARGEHLAAAQTLRIGLHLARAATAENLDPRRRRDALAAATRSLTAFEGFYRAHARIPEYLQLDGTDVPACSDPGPPARCLSPDDNALAGDTRIYALLARLALALGDTDLAAEVIDDRLLAARVSDTRDPRYGAIGTSTSGDADARDTLESLLTICLVSGGD